MSGIAGVVHLDGSPADVSILHRMGEALVRRGSDGVAHWQSGPVGFVHAQFWTTPESLNEKQPLRSPDGDLCLTLDGRIDNREEILQSLLARGAEPFDKTDPGLLLAAYKVWGTDCLQHIAGDFAFALWDQPKRTLWCARDPIGIRPFYYLCGPKRFLFASDIRTLLTHSGISLAINEGMVAEYLAFALSSRDETLYREIRRLPSSSTLTLTSNGDLRFNSWWRPDLSPLRYASDAEYAEHFTDLMERSVSARMRVHGDFACQLSGGLDSSTIAVTAQMLLDHSGAGQRLKTFSTIASGKPWDEADYIGATSQTWNFDSHCVPPINLGLDFYREEAGRCREFPGYPNSVPLFAGIYRAARDHGVRVLLAGHGGNHLLEGNLSHLADLATRGAFMELARIGKNDWEIFGGSGRWYVFVLRKMLLHLVPREVRVLRTRQNLLRSLPLSSGFITRTHLADRIEAWPRPDLRDFSSRAQRTVFHRLQDGEMVRAQEVMDRVSCEYGIEERHPFLDRRLVEFCLRIPEDQRQRGIFWKWVLRTAMKDKLPDRVLHRTRQADFSELFSTAVLEPEAQRVLGSLPRVSKTDWVEASRVREIASDPEELAGAATRMWMLLGIEMWLGTLPDFAIVGDFRPTS